MLDRDQCELRSARFIHFVKPPLVVRDRHQNVVDASRCKGTGPISSAYQRRILEATRLRNCKLTAVAVTHGRIKCYLGFNIFGVDETMDCNAQRRRPTVDLTCRALFPSDNCDPKTLLREYWPVHSDSPGLILPLPRA